MPRLAYVYEGIDTEKDGRPKLINVKYFGGGMKDRRRGDVLERGACIYRKCI